MLFQIKTINGQKTIVPLTADTGTGAPVGSIIVVCSNILPNGYLGLGVQYDITNYPALYQVLGTDTTPTASALGLPTLSSGQYAIKATSGLTENQQENVLNTINENNSYSTEEHPTGGKWIDGKPIYRKVIEQNFGTGQTIVTHNIGISRYIDVRIFVGSVQYVNSYLSSQYNLSIYDLNENTFGVTCNSWTGSGYIILEYTKTTD